MFLLLLRVEVVVIRYRLLLELLFWGEVVVNYDGEDFIGILGNYFGVLGILS